MRMGSTQRKSVRSMAEGENGKRGFSLPFAVPFTGSISAWATRGIVSLIAVVFAVTMLYFPCQNYYNETRQLQQLQAEYDALQEYNTQMQNQVDYLNTDEGIEDYARSELGWIRPGEHVVSVEGVTPSTDTSRSNDRVYAFPLVAWRSRYVVFRLFGCDLLAMAANSKRIAAFDIGTVTCRLLLAEVQDGVLQDLSVVVL